MWPGCYTHAFGVLSGPGSPAALAPLFPALAAKLGQPGKVPPPGTMVLLTAPSLRPATTIPTRGGKERKGQAGLVGSAIPPLARLRTGSGGRCHAPPARGPRQRPATPDHITSEALESGHVDKRGRCASVAEVLQPLRRPPVQAVVPLWSRGLAVGVQGPAPRLALRHILGHALQAGLALPRLVRHAFWLLKHGNANLHRKRRASGKLARCDVLKRPIATVASCNPIRASERCFSSTARPRLLLLGAC